MVNHVWIFIDLNSIFRLAIDISRCPPMSDYKFFRKYLYSLEMDFRVRVKIIWIFKAHLYMSHSMIIEIWTSREAFTTSVAFWSWEEENMNIKWLCNYNNSLLSYLPWGFSPEWILLCVFNELDVLKPFPHTEQTCGFSPRVVARSERYLWQWWWVSIKINWLFIQKS